MQQDYYSVLAGMITDSARGNPRLRNTIYDVARSRLRRQFDGEVGRLGDPESQRQMRELEAAIEQIEADLAEDRSALALAESANVTTIEDSALEIIPPARQSSPLWEARTEFTPEPTARFGSSIVGPILSLVGAAVLGVTAYIAIERVYQREHPPPIQTDRSISRNAAPNHSREMPLPGVYGVYALTNGQLTELEPLPIKVSDRTLAISGAISTASKTKLPSGRIQFVAFKRDLVNNAPEKVIVRVLAETTSTSSRNEDLATVGVGDSSVGRNISYEMKVAPVEGNPAMIIVRPANPEFSFPAGRYALVLKTVAYDFSVKGVGAN